jgi:hypothetical protein
VACWRHNKIQTNPHTRLNQYCFLPDSKPVPCVIVRMFLSHKLNNVGKRGTGRTRANPSGNQQNDAVEKACALKLCSGTRTLWLGVGGWNLEDPTSRSYLAFLDVLRRATGNFGPLLHVFWVAKPQGISAPRLLDRLSHGSRSSLGHV